MDFSAQVPGLWWSAVVTCERNVREVFTLLPDLKLKTEDTTTTSTAPDLVYK